MTYGSGLMVQGSGLMVKYDVIVGRNKRLLFPDNRILLF